MPLELTPAPLAGCRRFITNPLLIFNEAGKTITEVFLQPIRIKDQGKSIFRDRLLLSASFNQIKKENKTVEEPAEPIDGPARPIAAASWLRRTSAAAGRHRGLRPAAGCRRCRTLRIGAVDHAFAAAGRHAGWRGGRS